MRIMGRVAFALLMVLLHGGHWVFGSGPGTWILDDFEDGDLRAASGLSWVVIADDLAGGASLARTEIRPGGPPGSRHALGLTGQLSDGGRWPFAGAWVPLDRMGRSVNVGAFEGVRLRVKGPARLQIGFRAGMVNYMADVEAGATWRLVEIPFTSLTPLGKVPEGTRWSAAAVSVFGITTPQIRRGEDPTPGKVDIEVDDVALYGAAAEQPGPAASGPSQGLGVLPFTPVSLIPVTGWIRMAEDPARDGNTPSLPDATRLEAIPSSPDGMLWVRVTLREPPHDRWMGVNLVLDVDGDPDNGQAWWGANAGFKFDRLVTVWCMRVAEGCQGYIGLADAGQVASGLFVAGLDPKLRFAVDRARGAFIVGVPREALGLVKQEFRLVAAVGSALLYGDDVPGTGAATLH